MGQLSHDLSDFLWAPAPDAKRHLPPVFKTIDRSFEDKNLGFITAVALDAKRILAHPADLKSPPFPTFTPAETDAAIETCTALSIAAHTKHFSEDLIARTAELPAFLEAMHTFYAVKIVGLNFQKSHEYLRMRQPDQIEDAEKRISILENDTPHYSRISRAVVHTSLQLQDIIHPSAPKEPSMGQLISFEQWRRSLRKRPRPG